MPLPKKKDIEKVFSVLKTQNSKHDTTVNWKSWKFWLVAIPFILSLIFALIIRWFVPQLEKLLGRNVNVNDWLLLITLVLVALTYVALVYVQVYEDIKRRKESSETIQNPLTQTIMLAEESCVEGLSVAWDLQDIDKAAIDFVHEQLSLEREAVTSRIGSVIGALDKVGLLPGLITLYIGVQRINVPGLPAYVTQYLIPIIVSALYILFAFYTYPALRRLDRYLSFLDLARQRPDLPNDATE